MLTARTSLPPGKTVHEWVRWCDEDMLSLRMLGPCRNINQFVPVGRRSFLERNVPRAIGRYGWGGARVGSKLG